MKNLIIIENDGLEPIIGEEINILSKEETKELGMWGQLVQIRRLDNLNIESYATDWRFATFMDLHKYFKRKES